MARNLKIQLRKGTGSEWTSANPVLASGEPGYETDTGKLKIGYGGSGWNNLYYTAIHPTGLLAGSNIGVALGANGSSATISVTGTVDQAEQSQSLVTTVFNQTGAPIEKMTAVYINGGHGDRPTIQKAIATGDTTSAGTYGLTYEAIGINQTGTVIVFGSLNGLDTDQFNPNAPQGNVNGVTLYLSPTISGALTTTKPYAPNHIVAIGTITRTHQNDGIIEVRVQNGFELEELHNVAVTGATNGQFLQYNSGSGLWFPSSSGDFSSLTINNNQIVTGTGVANHIAYWNSSSGIVADSGQLYWDSTNNRLGVGTTSPLDLIHISGATASSVGIRFDNNDGHGGSVQADNGQLYLNSSTATAARLSGRKIRLGDGGASACAIELSSVGTISQDGNGGGLSFSGTTGQFSNGLHVTAGNVGIGTTTPSGQLHVIGTGLFSGKLGVGISGFPAWTSLSATPHTFVHISGASGLFPDVNERAFGSLLRLNSGASTNNPRIDFRIGGPGNYDNHFFISRNGTDVIGVDDVNKMFLPNGFTILNPTNNGEGTNASIRSFNDASSFITLDNNTRSMIIGYRGKGAGDQYIDIASSGRLKIYNYYSEVATFDNRGRFGIGTSTPSGQLHVIGTGLFSNSIGINTNSNSVGATSYALLVDGDVSVGSGNAARTLSVWGNNTTKRLLLKNVNGNSFLTYVIGSQDLNLGGPQPTDYPFNNINYYAGSTSAGMHRFHVSVDGTGLPPAMVIANSGVGIGTTSPSYTLDVSGTIGVSGIARFNNDIYMLDTTKRISWDNGTEYIGRQGDGIIIGTQSTTRILVNSAGNVGIGTTSPAESLTVYGDSKYLYLQAQNNTGAAGIKFGNTAARQQMYIEGTSSDLVIDSMNGGVTESIRIGYNTGAVTINESGSDLDFRVEGDTDANLVFVDASTDRVGIGTATPGYKLQVAGSFGATTKSFRIDHPSKPGWSLEYGSLESPYHGVRLTGRGKLVKGVGAVQLPDYLKDLIHDDESINIQITNIKHSKILFVDKIELKKDRFIVKAHRAKTLGELEFFWTLTGTRKDVENLVVEKEN